MEFETIRIEGDRPVRHLILNRPHVHNAVNRQFVADMNAALGNWTESRGSGSSFYAARRASAPAQT